MRCLGSTQTLILINGRRTTGPSPNGATRQGDINGIPLSAIDRIETLPSSASAIYGGAAVGVVVNVVLKRNYEGGEIKANYDNTFSTDAAIRTISASYGLSLEGGETRLMFSGQYSDATALLNQDRAQLLQRGLEAIRRNNVALISSPATPFFAGTTPNIGSTNGSNLVLKDGTPLNSPITFVPAGYSASSSPAALVANAGRTNFDLTNTVIRTGNLNQVNQAPAVESYLAVLRRQMTSRLELFAEFSSSRNSIDFLTAALNNVPIPVAATAPSNPFQQAVAVVTANTSPLIIPYHSGTKAALSWEQEHPNELILKFPDQPAQVWRRGNGYVFARGQKLTRVPFGHPEGYLEAFGNIYLEAFRAIAAEVSGEKIPRDADFPTIEDGVEGMTFIAMVVKSARLGARWVKFPSLS